MGTYAKLEVKESLESLHKSYGSYTDHKTKLKVKALICIKENRFRTRQELANYLEIGKRSLERWLKVYKELGFKQMCTPAKRNKKPGFLTQEIHQGVSLRIENPENPFRGYWEAHQWMEQQYGLELSYFNVRRYLIKYFKTKLKSGRKSHIKKDNQAEKAFLKTT